MFKKKVKTENNQTVSRRKRHKLTTRSLLIVLIPIFAVAVAVFVMLMTINEVADYKFNDAAYQYYLNNSYSISNGSTLKINNNNESIIEFDGVESKVSNLPIYLNSSNTIVIQSAMIYVNPRDVAFRRVPAFTEISVDNGNIIAKYDDVEKTLEPGFLFDGKNLYIYLEKMYVTFNNYTIPVSALSYTEAIYQDIVMNFNYEDKSCFYESPKGEAIAKEINDDYTISLIGDDVVNYKDQHYLIFTNPSDLESIFE